MREKIEEIEVEITPKRSSIKVSALVCNIGPVRKLESDFYKLETTIITLGDMNKKQRVEIGELENKLQLAIDGLEVISNLKTAYPESVFPPIGKETYHIICEHFGISQDRVSAHVLRSVAKGYSELADITLEKIKDETDSHHNVS